MAMKSFGVEKWSVRGSTTSRASGRASTSGSAGPQKSRSPMHTSTDAVTRPSSSAVRSRIGACRQATSASRSFSGWAARRAK